MNSRAKGKRGERNRSPWFCIVEAGELIELLALRERTQSTKHTERRDAA
jgi:hypothetical protein